MSFSIVAKANLDLYYHLELLRDLRFKLEKLWEFPHRHCCQRTSVQGGRNTVMISLTSGNCEGLVPRGL